MKWILRILAAPVVAFIAVFVWLFVQLLSLSAIVFALAGTIVGVIGLITLFAINVKNGIILLIIAFLIGPHGLPLLAGWLVAQLKGLQYIIQEKVYH